MGKAVTADVDFSLPDWGKGISTHQGYLRYYVDHAHDAKFTTDVDLVVVNLSYDETQLAVNSDRLIKVITPPNCSVFVPAGSDVHEISTHTTDAVMFEIPLDVKATLLSNFSQNSDIDLQYRNDIIDGDIGDLARLIRAASICQAIPDRLYIESLLTLAQERFISCYLDNDLNASLPTNKLNARSTKLVWEYMEAHLDENVTLQDLASAAYLSPYHFIRAFKASTGQTPYQALLERRLRQARRYLSNLSYSIADIALMTGFSSQSHLTESFRRYLGVTPGHFRQINKS
jgi:AraC family transcriptional regulator